jgi:(p)ppGpp synthase/HD superfamily hydrolase
MKKRKKITRTVDRDEHGRFVAQETVDYYDDAGISPEIIEKEFGKEVRVLVNSVSEDKMQNLSKKDSWKTRKQATINELETASKETMLVCNADKLANIRSMAYDQSIIGEKLWEKFNASKEDIKWYYTSIAKVLSPLSEYPMYTELISLIKEVF